MTSTSLQWIHSCGQRESLSWSSILPKGTIQAQDLASRLLRVSPESRCTAAEALSHPYLAAYHDVAYEPDCEAQVVVDAERIEQMNADEIKRELLQLVYLKHRLHQVKKLSYSNEIVLFLKVTVNDTSPVTSCSHNDVEMMSAKPAEAHITDGITSLPFVASTHPRLTEHERQVERKEQQRRSLLPEAVQEAQKKQKSNPSQVRDAIKSHSMSTTHS